MNNCKDCRHWRLEPDTKKACGECGGLLPTHWANCSKIGSVVLPLAGWGSCLLVDSTDDGDAERSAKGSAPLAITEDSEGRYAWLKTSPDFGCVQFEAKT
jgi:hypothetical protein